MQYHHRSGTDSAAPFSARQFSADLRGMRERFFTPQAARAFCGPNPAAQTRAGVLRFGQTYKKLLQAVETGFECLTRMQHAPAEARSQALRYQETMRAVKSEVESAYAALGDAPQIPADNRRLLRAAFEEALRAAQRLSGEVRECLREAGRHFPGETAGRYRPATKEDLVRDGVFIGPIVELAEDRGYGFMRVGLQNIFFHVTDRVRVIDGPAGRSFERVRIAPSLPSHGTEIVVRITDAGRGPRAEIWCTKEEYEHPEPCA